MLIMIAASASNQSSRIEVNLTLKCLRRVGTQRDFTNQGFGRVYLILPQNKAKICPIIVTMPTG